MQSYPFTSQVTYDEQDLPIYDRAVDSAFLREVFAQYFSDGVFYKPTSAFQVTVGAGMNVLVNPGACHIRGAVGIEKSQRTLAIQTAETMDRIDTVVLRLDLSLQARSIDLFVVKGTASTAPQAPALTRDSTVWELGLANIFVAKNTSSVTQQRITDTRLDNTRCGVVAQTIGELDTSPYFEQVQAMIEDLEDTIQGIEGGSGYVFSLEGESGHLTLADVGAVPESEKAQPGGIATLDSSGKLEQMPTAADVGAVPTSRTVNGKALSSNISLTAADVGAAPTSRTVNGHALTGNVTVTPNDIFKQYTVVPNGTNFNTLRSPGLYMQTSNDKTTNNVNSPVTGSAFVMMVFNDTVDKVGWQIFYGYRGRQVFVRGWDLWIDTYEPWMPIYTSAQRNAANGLAALDANKSIFGATGAGFTDDDPQINFTPTGAGFANTIYGTIHQNDNTREPNGFSFFTNSGNGQRHAIQYYGESTGQYRFVLRPWANGQAYLGTTTFRWNTGYFVNQITQSDLKTKEDISAITNAKAFIMALNPIAYKLINGEGGRTHLGFGAQEVAQAAEDTNMGDLAMYQASEVDEKGHEQYYTPEAKEENLSWGLNYNELIAPLVAVVQQQEQRIQALENKIKQLTEVSA